jgi:hypothetical protein
MRGTELQMTDLLRFLGRSRTSCVNLFGAVPGKVNDGPDCCSGRSGDDIYDVIDAKSFRDELPGKEVQDVYDLYGGKEGAQIAVVAGKPGYSRAAILKAKELDVHLWIVEWTRAHYSARRVYP